MITLRGRSIFLLDESGLIGFGWGALSRARCNGFEAWVAGDFAEFVRGGSVRLVTKIGGQMTRTRVAKRNLIRASLSMFS
jgi:hypothetical protein